jgi:hypothetical protein
MSPHVIPLFSAVPTIYRGEAVALFAAHRARAVHSVAADREVDLWVSTIRSLADEFGLSPLDRYLTLVPMRQDSVLVAYGPHGIGLEVARARIDVRTSVKPSEEWMELVRSHGKLLVMVVAQRNSSDLDLRTLLSSNRAFGAYAAVTAVHSDGGRRRYALLGSEGEDEGGFYGRCVFLDANVHVHLEKAASGSSNDAVRDRQVQQFAIELAHQEVVGAFSIAELATNRVTRAWDNERANSLRATIDAWFGGGGIETARDMEAVRDAYRKALAHYSSVEDSRTGMHYPVQLAFYVCLLKVAQLWNEVDGGYRAIQRVELYEEFAHWMMGEFGYNLSYPLILARDRFVGPQDSRHVGYVDKLMKFGKDPLRNLWGAAWDLTHLAHVDRTLDPSFWEALQTGGESIVLATDDKALPRMRERLRVRTAIHTDSYSVTLMESETMVDRRLEHHQARIDDIDRWVIGSTLSRQVGPRRLEYWQEAVQKAEREYLDADATQYG